MRYASATVKGYSAVKTKKDLKTAVGLINAQLDAGGSTITDVDVTLNDPFGLGSGTMGITDLLDANDDTSVFRGVALQVSNEKRSWFANVQVKNERLVVS